MEGENKKTIINFLKNPLWIIVILLIVMNVLLWNISQNIGHDVVAKDIWGQAQKATGLYRELRGIEGNTVK